MVEEKGEIRMVSSFSHPVKLKIRICLVDVAIPRVLRLGMWSEWSRSSPDDIFITQGARTFGMNVHSF